MTVNYDTALLFDDDDKEPNPKKKTILGLE